MNSLEAVYEKYKHLDHLLSDAEWLTVSDDRAAPNLQAHILYDLWQAVRSARGQSEPALLAGAARPK
jgi:hypothetical protein